MLPEYCGNVYTLKTSAIKTYTQTPKTLLISGLELLQLWPENVDGLQVYNSSNYKQKMYISMDTHTSALD